MRDRTIREDNHEVSSRPHREHRAWRSISAWVFPALAAVALSFFGSCAIPPIAFNMMIPAEEMPRNSSELGFGAGGYNGKVPDYSEALGFVYYPLWLRANVEPHFDVVGRAYVTSTGALVGGDLSYCLKGFRLTGGAYPLSLSSENGFQASMGLWPQASVSYDLNSASGGGGRVAVSLGVAASLLAIGPVLDLNSHLSPEWAVRTELGVLFPPPWYSDVVKGTAVNLSAGLVRTFPAYRE